MPQARVWRPSPVHRDGTERRPIEFHKVRVMAE
jgi:hypothetical protein